MLKIEEIQSLIKAIDESSINEFTYEIDGGKIELKKQGAQQAVQTAPAIATQQPTITQAEANVSTQVEPTQLAEQQTTNETPTNGDYEITSPMVGTFYSSSSPDAEAFVSIGDTVESDSVVCIVEAMKLFNEIEAEITGEIVEILVTDGELVEYGQPLFRVKTK